MNENKEYIMHGDELGNIYISEEVLSVIAAAAAMEVEGVSGVAASGGKELTELFGKKSAARGVRIQLSEESVLAEVTILVKYGHAIQDVARAVQDAVATNIESMSGLKVQAVNVTVGGIAFEREGQRNA